MDHEEMTLEQQVADDLLSAMDATDFIYRSEPVGTVIAEHYSRDGNLLGQYVVKVTLEKL